jgi:hypothetical protein
MSLLIGLGAFLLAVIGSDLVLNGAKVQTGLAKVLLVYASVGSVVLLYLRWVDGSLVAFAIFWGGGFLSWFGVHSHVESSILLRMLALLQQGRKTRGELLQEYEACCGQAQRLEELLRAGLVVEGAQAIELTPKGRLIVRAAAWLH